MKKYVRPAGVLFFIIMLAFAACGSDDSLARQAVAYSDCGGSSLAGSKWGILGDTGAGENETPFYEFRSDGVLILLLLEYGAWSVEGDTLTVTPTIEGMPCVPGTIKFRISGDIITFFDPDDFCTLHYSSWRIGQEIALKKLLPERR